MTITQPLQTRATKAEGFKREDVGYGWGRICAVPTCRAHLNHFNPNEICAPCELRQEAEERQAA